MKSNSKETGTYDCDQITFDNDGTKLMWITRIIPVVGIFLCIVRYRRIRAELSIRILIAAVKSVVMYTALILGMLHQLGLIVPVYNTASSGGTADYDYPHNIVVMRVVFRATVQGGGMIKYYHPSTNAFNEEYFEGDSYEKVLSEEEIEEINDTNEVSFDVYSVNVAREWENSNVIISREEEEASCSIEINGVIVETDSTPLGYAYCTIYEIN